MAEQRPQKIDLTDEEEALLAQIIFHPKNDNRLHETLKISCAAAAPLADSILSRKAVPEIRRRYFTDLALNIGLKKSRKGVFEANGTKGEAILRHSHFLPYLEYFIYGPQLPDKVIDEFWHLASGFDVERGDLHKLARNMTRQFELSPREASEEFFKLALECGMMVDDARSVRDAVKTVR
jgi:hypothetical protein